MCNYLGSTLEMGVIFDNKVKKGCYILFIMECGAFHLFRLDPGLLPSADSSFLSQVSSVFMQNLNYPCTEVGNIAVIIPKSCCSKETMVNLPCCPVLRQGVTRIGDVLYFVYRRWSHHVVGPMTVTSLISNTMDNGQLLDTLFSSDISLLIVSEVHVVYFNLIYGYSHPDWKSSIIHLTHPNGGMYFESSSHPDNWQRNSFLNHPTLPKINFVRLFLPPRPYLPNTYPKCRQKASHFMLLRMLLKLKSSRG